MQFIATTGHISLARGSLKLIAQRICLFVIHGGHLNGAGVFLEWVEKIAWNFAGAKSFNYGRKIFNLYEGCLRSNQVKLSITDVRIPVLIAKSK